MEIELTDGLENLNYLEISHQNIFTQAVNINSEKSWLYYFPFLHGFSQYSNQTLLWEKIDESICLYIIRKRSSGRLRLHLFLPPFPFNRSALLSAFERINNFNKDHKGYILWVDQNNNEYFDKKEFASEWQESEFIYDTKAILELNGSKYANLRRMISQSKRIEGLSFRSYQIDDYDDCIQLYKRWKRDIEKITKHRVGGSTYTYSTLENALHFSDDILKGEVATKNSEIIAFTFGGKINNLCSSIYLTHSLRDYNGLGALQRYHFMLNNSTSQLFNDSSDSGRSGIATLKQKFKPIEMNALYQVFQKEKFYITLSDKIKNKKEIRESLESEQKLNRQQLKAIQNKAQTCNFFSDTQIKGVKGFEQFFKLVSLLKPIDSGEKIVVISEFIILNNNEEVKINSQLFQRLIKEANIDKLYSIGKFNEHINVLNDKNIWKSHSYWYNNIKQQLKNQLKNNNIICFGGLESSEMGSLNIELQEYLARQNEQIL